MKKFQAISVSLGSFLLLILLLHSQTVNASVCWKRSYDRGAGSIPGSCDPGLEKNGLLCYPKCDPGYTGLSFVCWQNCPTGFRNDGAFCAKPKSYGRGVGYAIWNEVKCNIEHGGEGSCEKCLAMYYPKCAPGFHAVGCNVCSPDCPEGMTDIGVSCAKKAYTRKTMTPKCGDKDYSAGLCYNECNENYNGIGPVCWGQCPADRPINCGALCGKTANDCTNAIFSQVVSVGEMAAKIASMVATFGASSGATAAASAAEESAILTLKTLAKKLAKEIANKFVNLGKRELKARLLEELKKIGVPGSLVDGLAEMASNPEKVNYKDFLKAIDPIGVYKVVAAFNKDICAVEARTPSNQSYDEVYEALEDPQTIASESPDMLKSGSCVNNYCLVARSGQYKACQQSDGNLVIYNGPNAAWSNNKNIEESELCLESNGNLVAFDKKGRRQWSSNTENKGEAPYRLHMQNDGNLVVYDSVGKAIWSSGDQI